MKAKTIVSIALVAIGIMASSQAQDWKLYVPDGRTGIHDDDPIGVTTEFVVDCDGDSDDWVAATVRIDELKELGEVTWTRTGKATFRVSTRNLNLDPRSLLCQIELHFALMSEATFAGWTPTGLWSDVEANSIQAVGGTVSEQVEDHVYHSPGLNVTVLDEKRTNGVCNMYIAVSWNLEPTRLPADCYRVIAVGGSQNPDLKVEVVAVSEELGLEGWEEYLDSLGNLGTIRPSRVALNVTRVVPVTIVRQELNRDKNEFRVWWEPPIPANLWKSTDLVTWDKVGGSLNGTKSDKNAVEPKAFYRVSPMP